MTPFFVQIKCQLGKAYQVANALAESEIASEIYSTAGDYDLLVKFYVEAGTDIGHFVNEKVQCIPGHQGHAHHHHLQGVSDLNALARMVTESTYSSCRFCLMVRSAPKERVSNHEAPTPSFETPRWRAAPQDEG